MEAEENRLDPQFMNMLEICLNVEIETATTRLFGLESDISKRNTQIRTVLNNKRNLKEWSRNASENVAIFSATSIKQAQCSNATNYKIGLTKLNLDNSYKILQLELEQYATTIREYDKAWQSYYEKYEAFPLAKARKEANVKFEKLHVSKMVLEFKIAECHKILKLNRQITWLRMRGKIIDLARAISNMTMLQGKLKDVNDSIENSTEELRAIETELAAQSMREEEEKKARTLKVLEMSPPKIHFSDMCTIYERQQRPGFLNQWDRNYENSLDTMSVDTLMFEEQYATDESSMQLRAEASFQQSQDEDRVYVSRPIDATSPFLDQEQPEVEQVDGTSDVDRNVGPDPIDAPDEEVEQRMDQELEHLEQRSGVSKDKQTGQCGEELAEEMYEPSTKRIRLICVEGTAVAPPGKIERLEGNRSETDGAKSTPKIRKIENVHYNFPPTRKMEKNVVHLASVPGAKQSVDQIPERKISNIFSADQINEGASPNPSSMFMPRNYDFSDSSMLSFCVGNNVNLQETERVSLDGQSIQNFCECSNISTYNEDAAMEPAVKSNGNAASTSKAHSFTQFDFTNILGGNSSRKNLF